MNFPFLDISNPANHLNAINQETRKMHPTQQKQWRQLGSEEEIIRAVKNGDFEAVQTLIEQDTQNVLTLSDTGVSPLYLACIFGHTEILLYLIEIEKTMALDPDFKALGVGNFRREEGRKGFCAMTYTHHSNRTNQQNKQAILNILQQENNKRGKELEYRNSKWTHYIWTHYEHPPKPCINLQWQYTGINPPLLTAIQHNNTQAAQRLIHSNRNYLLQRSEEGLSPLHEACLLGHAEIAKLILEQENLLLQQYPELDNTGVGDPNRVESNTLPMSALDCLRYSFSYKENKQQQLSPLLESLESSAARVTEEREHAQAKRHVDPNNRLFFQSPLSTRHNELRELYGDDDDVCNTCTIS